MIFNDVTFTTEEFVLTMTPIKYYNTQGSVLRVYVTYKIDLKIMGTGESIESHVHYYLSDGHTNTLRANLFYPFLYFDIKKQLPSQSTAPTRRVLGSVIDAYRSNELVVKLQTVKNLDLKRVEKERSTYLRGFSQDTGGLNPEKGSRNITAIYPNDPKKAKVYDYNTNGIFSILSRLDNIIDLILAVTCPEVVNFNYDAAKLSHNYVRYRPRIDETYNMDEYERLPPDAKFDQHFRFDDYMRLEKLKELQQLRVDIMKGGRLDITPRDLPVNIYTYEEFNREIGINYEGIDLPIPSTLSGEFKTRVENYNTLSRALAIKLFTRRVPFILDPTEMRQIELLDYLKRGWGVHDAYKKYLKYKAKYLKLKQSMKLS